MEPTITIRYDWFCQELSSSSPVVLIKHTGMKVLRIHFPDLVDTDIDRELELQ